MKLFTITLDLDGTICDTYSRPTWLEELQSHKVTPFKLGIAKPFVNRLVTVKLLSLIANIDVCTWLPPQAQYDKTFRQECVSAKNEWVSHYLPFVRNMYCVDYGTPKIGQGILIDDSAKVRQQWQGLALSDQVLGGVRHKYIHH